MVDIVHDPEEINRFVADVSPLDVSNAAGHSIDGFVSQFFGEGAAALSEDRYQTPTDSFVDFSRPVAICIEPREQAIKILSLEFPEISRR